MHDCAIALFATGRIQIWHAYVLMFVRWSMQAFQFQPAAEHADAGAAQLARPRGRAQPVDPGSDDNHSWPLGALALGVFPIQGALMIDVVTALLGIVPLLIFRIPQARTAPTAPQFFRVLLEGLRYVGRWPGMCA